MQYGQYDLEKITTLLEAIDFLTNSAVGPDMSAAGVELNIAPIMMITLRILCIDYFEHPRDVTAS